MGIILIMSFESINLEDYLILDKSLSNKSEKLEKIDNLKKYKAKKEKFIFNLGKCGVQKRVLKCKNCAKRHFLYYRCNSRLCERCSTRLYSQIRLKFTPLVYSMKYVRFLTLTQKMVIGDIKDLRRDLSRKFELLNKSINRDKKYFVGGIYSIHIDEREGGYHAHIHAIVDCRTKVHARARKVILNEELIKKKWSKICGYDATVDFPAIVDRRHALSYILRYVTKPLVVRKEDLIDFYLKPFYKTRMFSTFGEHYNRKEKVRLSDIDGYDEVGFYCSCGSNKFFDEGVEGNRNYDPKVSYLVSRIKVT